MGRWFAALALGIVLGAWLGGDMVLAQPRAPLFLTAHSDSRPHGEPWELRIFEDGTLQQYVADQKAPTVSTSVPAGDLAHLKAVVHNVDLLHLAWPPGHDSASGLMSLLVHTGDHSNYVEWSGQKDDGAFRAPRIRFARVWVAVLHLFPSPNEWETPDFFAGWLR